MSKEKNWELKLLTDLEPEEKKDKYLLLLENVKTKYPEVFSQIKKWTYNEDKDKVLDTIFLSILDVQNIQDFRMARSDNRTIMQKYGQLKREKISDKNISQFDSSVYSKKTNIVYYYGFNY